MLGYNHHIPSPEKNILQVTRISAITVEVMNENVVHCLNSRYPGMTTVNVALNVSCDGIMYRKGMIIVHGSLCGLPEFGIWLQESE